MNRDTLKNAVVFVGAVVLEAVAMVSRAGLFVALAVAVGVGTSWYLSNRPSALTATTSGPWMSWTSAGQMDADPYTRARYAQIGSLPISSTSVQTFEARTDATGQRLHSSCEYLIEGRPLDVPWWSIAVYTEGGKLIANPAGRHGFNKATLSLAPDGTYLISMAREARPGNWLPTGGAGRLALVLSVYQQAVTRVAGSAGPEPQLPEIRRVLCR